MALQEKKQATVSLFPRLVDPQNMDDLMDCLDPAEREEVGAPPCSVVAMVVYASTRCWSGPSAGACLDEWVDTH